MELLPFLTDDFMKNCKKSKT